MTVAERIVVWNRWYDAVSEEWRFHFVVWSLLVLGAINMLLTIAVGFPFALLVVLGIIVIAAVRLPYFLGWVTPSTDPQTNPQFQIAGASRWVGLNQRYEAMPESRRIWVYPAILLIAGAINMMLTIAYGFPFGLLFLLALLFLVLVRAPYTAGWLQHQAPVQAAVVSEPVDLGPPHHEPPSAYDDTPPAPDYTLPPHHEPPPAHDDTPDSHNPELP